jgi:hypothetical protein
MPRPTALREMQDLVYGSLVLGERTVCKLTNSGYVFSVAVQYPGLWQDYRKDMQEQQAVDGPVSLNAFFSSHEDGKR